MTLIKNADTILLTRSPDNYILTVFRGESVSNSTQNTSELYYSQVTNISGQTTFTLPSIPSNPSLSKVFVNGAKYEFLVDYIISGYNVNWSGPQIPRSMKFEIYY